MAHERPTASSSETHVIVRLGLEEGRTVEQALTQAEARDLSVQLEHHANVVEYHGHTREATARIEADERVPADTTDEWLDVLRSEWVMANPNTRGPFPRRKGD